MLLAKNKLMVIFTFIIFSLFLFVSCAGENGIDAGGTGTISMKIGDDPFPINLVSRAEIIVDKIEIRSTSETGMNNGSKYYVILEEPIKINLINY